MPSSHRVWFCRSQTGFLPRVCLLVAALAALANPAQADEAADTASAGKAADTASAGKAADTASAGKAAADGWRPLTDPATIEAWKSTPFGGEGEIERADGLIRIGMGVDLSGITWSGPFPKQSYEIALEARRVDGNDFFCGLTFPVGEQSCSLILGGWGGAVVGLSSIDGLDAAHNDTTQFRDFEKNRWYAVNVKVTPATIECCLDDEPIIQQPIENRRISVRDEVIPSKPLGIATYSTVGEAKNIRFRKLPAAAETSTP